MNRKPLLVLMFLTAVLPAYASNEIKSKSDALEAAKPKPRTAEEEKKLTETRKRIETKKTELNGSEWELSLGSSTDSKMKAAKDTFTFQDGQFKSENLSKRGFASTNYTISVPSPDSESAVWETMQTGKEGLVFIRGEWEKDKMDGHVTEQLDGGKKVVEYYFSTASRKTISPTSAKEEKASPAEGEEDQGSGLQKALVSKETAPPDTQPIKNKQVVAPFVSGTTDEMPDSGKK